MALARPLDDPSGKNRRSGRLPAGAAGSFSPRLPALFLRAAGVDNVAVHEGNGLAGLPGDAPFDAIMLSGSVGDVPRVLREQLKVGGRLFAIVGDAPAMRAVRITRVAPDAWQTEGLFETVAPRLIEPARNGFTF